MTTEILNSPPHLPSSSSPIKCLIPTKNNQHSFLQDEPFINSEFVALCKRKLASAAEEEERGNQLSLLAVFLAVFRKSIVGCKRISGNSRGVEEQLMEIGWPSNVRHVAHVTFDRFNGFLGLPVEFEPEVPRRPPSASTRVFGVSTESMQLSYDSRGNCVPTILPMMQRRLYLQGGLQSEGIFRINAENGQEEYVREQLNSGLIPENIDVHCLAGLIKAWFRELPRGVLDCLSTEQVMQAQSEDQCASLVTLLPPTEAALLDWAVNLMADIAQFEYLNKMNARNIAMVFAPNMTQMSDPLTALMYVVQVMNFLKTLVVKTLREREDSILEDGPNWKLEPSNEYGRRSISKAMEANEVSTEKEGVEAKEPLSNGRTNSSSHYEFEPKTCKETHSFRSSIEHIFPYEKEHGADIANSIGMTNGEVGGGNAAVESWKSLSKSQRITKTEQLSYSNNHKKGSRKHIGGPVIRVNENAEKSKDISIIRRANLHKDRGEAWR